MLPLVSLHFEWVISLRLRRDLTPDELAEVRWHLGIDNTPPMARVMPEDTPLFAQSNTGWMPGGHIVVLREQDSIEGRSVGMYVRTLVTDDGMYEFVQTVPPWLARVSATQGWIGMAREEMALDVWLNFYVQDGHAYAGGPGESPQALTPSAPPFTLTGTSW
jgi:hypothetical protein